MSNFLNSVSLTTGQAGSQTQTDALVQAFLNTKQPDIDALNTKKANLQAEQTMYNTLNTKLNTLTTSLDTLTATNASSNFADKTVTSSDATILSATADGTAAVGINTVQVDRLASNDLLISNRVNISDPSTMQAGAYTFSVNGNNVTVNLTTDDVKSNDSVLNKIATAINGVTNIGVSASVIKDTTSTERLTMTSSTTGVAIKFGGQVTTDSSGNSTTAPTSDILSSLGIDSSLNSTDTSRTKATSTGAGFKETDVNNLLSQIEVNGITITRDTNSISDAMTGITLNLQQADPTTVVTLQSSVDTKSVSSYIQPLLDSYNDMLTFLKGQDPTTLRTAPGINSLYTRLRNLPSTAVTTTASPTDPNYLSEIGITTSTTGTLSISDSTALQTALQANPQQVANLFTSSDSFVAKLQSAVSNLSGSTGLIQSENSSLSNQIDATTKKTTDTQNSINSQADALRTQYNNMLQVYLQAQTQYQTFSSIQSAMASSSSSSSTSTSTTG